VTIEDITERADLGRTTFYLHYHDKEELLLESIDSTANELLERILPQVKGVRGMDISGPALDAIRITFQHAYENAQLYRVILRGGGASPVSARLHEIISQTAARLLQLRLDAGNIQATPHIPVEVFSNYFAGALLAMITWGLETGATYTPDEMAVMFTRLFFIGGRSAILED